VTKGTKAEKNGCLSKKHGKIIKMKGEQNRRTGGEQDFSSNKYIFFF
jgi:hypothetical protein